MKSNSSRHCAGLALGLVLLSACGDALEPNDASVATFAAQAGDYGAFAVTYYPYNGENWPSTTCGSTGAHGGLFFAVTEHSPLWGGACDTNGGWAKCSERGSACTSRWDQIPEYWKGVRIKKIQDGERYVLEPSCNPPCGTQVEMWNEADSSKRATAYVWDACPALHWNNATKEANGLGNPCAMGAHHVDIWVTLFNRLGNPSNVRIAAAGSNPQTPAPGGAAPNGGAGTTRDGKCITYCPNGSANDPDRDGWGWANNATCIVRESRQDTRQPCGSSSSGTGNLAPRTSTGTNRDGKCFAYCPKGSADDPDRDGWGWANGVSCIVRESRQDTRRPC